MKKSKNDQQIVIYKAKDEIKLEVKLEKETVWLTQKQIAHLFQIDRSVVTKHVRNILKDKELERKSVCAIFAHTAEDGKSYHVEFFNLDMIISVGYRVNSKRATQFRIWATRILKEYVLKGYVLNQKRLSEVKEKKLEEFERAVGLIKQTIDSKKLSGDEEKGLLRVITEYANSWVLLNKFDKRKIALPAKTTKDIFRIDYEFAKDAILELKKDLLSKKEAGSLFGQESQYGLNRIIGSIHQTFGKKDLYPGIEEKAAHLLYFIIKDHPFTDGNKRIGSFLFIVFLARNKYLLRKNGEKKINDNALVALALLIAESKPKDKNIMIALTTNLLL